MSLKGRPAVCPKKKEEGKLGNACGMIKLFLTGGSELIPNR